MTSSVFRLFIFFLFLFLYSVPNLLSQTAEEQEEIKQKYTAFLASRAPAPSPSAQTNATPSPRQAANLETANAQAPGGLGENTQAGENAADGAPTQSAASPVVEP